LVENSSLGPTHGSANRIDDDGVFHNYSPFFILVVEPFGISGQSPDLLGWGKQWVIGRIALRFFAQGLQSKAIGIFEQASTEGGKSNPINATHIQFLGSVDDLVFQAAGTFDDHGNHHALHNFIIRDLHFVDNQGLKQGFD
jgi:hypothetical protein